MADHENCGIVTRLAAKKRAAEAAWEQASSKRQEEAVRRPSPDYIEKVQRDFTAESRGILVDWLAGYAEIFNFPSDVLHLTVLYIDSFLSAKVINRQRFLLLGVSSMFIACKYEYIEAAELEAFRIITKNKYTRDEIEEMEFDVLTTLSFELGGPTTNTFLRRFTRIAQKDINEKHNLKLELLGCYLAELSLLEYECLKFLPCLVAASVIFLSRLTLQPKLHPWNLDLQQCSGYKAAELVECVDILLDLQSGRRRNTLSDIRNKYKKHLFKCVAKLSPRSKVPESFFQDNHR